MGSVYEASKDGNQFALKTCDSTESDDIARFMREIRMIASISNEHVVKVFDTGQWQGIPYFTMEYATSSLTDVIDKLNNEQCFDYTLQVCDGIEAIHRQGVIHRDIKPDNILLIDGVVKVADFGLGRFVDRDTISITQPGQSMGTYGYAAPELYDPTSGSFKEGSPALDIFALGGVIYNIFSRGARPDMINPRNVQADILSVIRRCREQEPEERPSSVSEVKNMISAIYRSRTGYDSIKEVADDKSLSSEESAKQALSLFSRAETSREAIDMYGEMRNLCWPSIIRSGVNYGDVLIQTLLKLLENDTSTWLQFEDIDVIADFTVITINASKDDDLRRDMLRKGINLSVGYNRWAAMKRIFEGLICKWTNETVLPFCEVIVSQKERFEAIEASIGVTMPRVVKKYW